MHVHVHICIHMHMCMHIHMHMHLDGGGLKKLGMYGFIPPPHKKPRRVRQATRPPLETGYNYTPGAGARSTHSWSRP